MKTTAWHETDLALDGGDQEIIFLKIKSKQATSFLFIYRKYFYFDLRL